MEFIPTLPVVLAYTGAVILITLTPGPDMTLFLGKAVTQGRTAGLAAFFGATTGVVFHTSFAAFGLSALLAASEAAFGILKIVGAGYLLWLAYQAIRHGSGLSFDPSNVVQQSNREVFLTGLGINLLNPKIVLFFVTFLPQFVEPGDPHAAGKLMFLGVLFITIAVPMCVPMILLADRVSIFVRRSPIVTRVVDWTFAGVMGAFAVKLLAAQAK